MKKYLSKFECALLISILCSVAFFFIYKNCLLFYFTQRYDDVLFTYNSNYYSIIFFCAFAIIGVSNYFSKERKMHPRKYWLIFSCIGVIIFALVSYFSTQAWVVTKNSISYNTIFTRNEIFYDYGDLERVELYYNESIGIKGNGVSPEYKIETEDGKTIILCLLESYYISPQKIIEFDRLVGDKRVCIGEYNSLHIEDELNQYYQEIFNQSRDKTGAQSGDGSVIEP